LDQDKADEVEHFLRMQPREKLHISEFSLYSVGIALLRRKLFDTFVQFLDDLILKGGIRLLRLPVQSLADLPAVAQAFNLDFDDAYQYLVAEKHGAEIISFDADFDRTQKGRKMPGMV
jgi:predicted nucleic acid-binding protein